MTSTYYGERSVLKYRLLGVVPYKSPDGESMTIREIYFFLAAHREGSSVHL